MLRGLAALGAPGPGEGPAARWQGAQPRPLHHAQRALLGRLAAASRLAARHVTESVCTRALACAMAGRGGGISGTWRRGGPAATHNSYASTKGRHRMSKREARPSRRVGLRGCAGSASPRGAGSPPNLAKLASTKSVEGRKL